MPTAPSALLEGPPYPDVHGVTSTNAIFVNMLIPP
jgi:hypothetical protein